MSYGKESNSKCQYFLKGFIYLFERERAGGKTEGERSRLSNEQGALIQVVQSQDGVSCLELRADA